MSKKPIKKETTKRQREKDIIGLALIVVSVFFLLCMSIPVVLGAVSRGVRNFAIGSFGYLAFPMFICLAVYGVILIQDRTLGVRKKTAFQILGITLLSIFILTLATSHAEFMTYGFGDYLSAVYANHTAGGAFFGIFAYAIAAAITPVAAYIVMALGIALIVLIMVKNKFFPKGATKRVKAKESRQEKRIVKKPHSFNPNQVATQSAKTQNVPCSQLFVENIQPTQQVATFEESSFSEMKSSMGEGERQHSFLLKDEEFELYKNSAQTVEIDRREEAMKTLFGDRTISPYNAHSFVPPVASHQAIVPTPVMASPSISRPPIIIHDEVSLIPKEKKQQEAQSKSELKTAPVLLEKDLVPVNSGREIINGYEFSKKLEEQLGVAPSEKESVVVPSKSEQTRGSQRIEIESVPLVHRPSTTSPLGKSIPYGLLNDYPIDTYNNTTAKTTKAYDMSTISSYGSPVLEPVVPQTIASRPVAHIPEKPILSREPVVKTFAQPAPAIKEEKNESMEDVGEKFSKIDDFADEKFEEIEVKEKIEETIHLREENAKEEVIEIKEEEQSFNILDKITFDVAPSNHKTGFAIEEEVEFTPEFLKKAIKEEPEFITQDKLDIETVEEEEEELVLDFSETGFDAYQDHTGHYVEAETKPENPFKGLNKKSKSRVATVPLPDQVSLFQPPQEVVARKKKTTSKYVPPLTEFLVNQITHPQEISPEEIQRKAQIIEDTLQDFKVPATVKNITKGPAVTRYELEISPGFPVKRV
ncbi:MAG: hypothetical protein FWC11_05350, partial [Firmicutes bacterium]|nr:hypothetical protein [Bacillota bacterium]